MIGVWKKGYFLKHTLCSSVFTDLITGGFVKWEVIFFTDGKTEGFLVVGVATTLKGFSVFIRLSGVKSSNSSGLLNDGPLKEGSCDFLQELLD